MPAQATLSASNPNLPQLGTQLTPSIIAEEKLTRAKVNLLIEQPFIATILLNLQVMEAPPGLLHTPTMATNGRKIWWHRAFVDQLTTNETMFVLAHECWHVAAFHHLRRGMRDGQLWNHAGDHVLNLMLEKSGMKMPQNEALRGLADPQYAGMSTEQVYDKLPESDRNTPQYVYVMDLTGGGDGSEPERPLTDSERLHADQQVKQMLQSALQTAKSKGNVPGDLERYVDEMTQSKIPWHEHIRAKLLYNAGHGHWDMRQPSRRYVQSGIFLPRVIGEHVGDVIVVRDTSGSIGDEELILFNAEIYSITEDLKATVHLYDCDTQLYPIGVFKPGADWEEIKHSKGGGGTQFEPIFELLRDQSEDLEIKPIAVVYLTDMYSNRVDEDLAPNCPVFWVSTTPVSKLGSRTQDFGEILDLNA